VDKKWMAPLGKTYYVYILSSKSRVIYTGVTSDLQKRLWEHRLKTKDGFTKHYRVDRLVYFEAVDDAMAAIEREKQIKSWRRAKKNALIEKANPAWDDLSVKFKLV
jgi:putative endonuclease